MSASVASGRTYPPKPSDVYLFATCLVDQFAPQVGMDTVTLLEREGIRVHYPEQQTCCGQPAHSSGYPDEARSVALAQLNLFTEAWPVIVPSGSCGGMMRTHYPDLFVDDPVLHDKALALADRIFELSEFLVHVVNFSHADEGEPCTIALHTSCHARRQMGVHDTSLALIESLDNVQLTVHARVEECCGFGGTFALLYPDISEAIVSDKVASLKATPAQCVVSADCGCLLNITGRSARLDEVAGCSSPSLPGEHLASFLLRRTSGIAA